MVTFYSDAAAHYRARVLTQDGFMEYDGNALHEWMPVQFDAPLKDSYVPNLVYYTKV